MTVDNAQMRYFIVHLHRLLEPEAGDGKTLTRRPARGVRASPSTPFSTQDHSRAPVFVRLLRECMLPHWHDRRRSRSAR